MKLNYRKLRLSFALLIGCGVLGLANAARADEPDPTTPQPMPISCRAPKPAGQSGLRRPQGDGNVWTFTITTDPDDNVHWVEGPNWSYPGKGAGSDPSWGVWGGGDDEMWLSWSSPQIAAPFTVRVTGKITCGTGPGGGEPIDIEASWSGEVTSFDIFVRRMGTSDEFGKSATVAAGAVGNDAHQAEIEVRAKDSAGNPVAGVSIPAIRIKEGGRGLSADPEVKVSAPSMSSTITDAEGKARGVFTSGNWEESTVLELDVADENKPSVNIVQKWNELGAEAWQYEDEFIPGEASDLSYMITFDGGVAIRGHSVWFDTTGLFGYEWKPDAEVDEDGDGEVDYLGKYEPETYSGDDIYDAGYGGLVTYGSNPAPESSDGVYTTSQTINDYIGPEGYIDYWVETVEFDVVDDNVLEIPLPSTP